MAFFEELFPERISLNMSGGPRWTTDVAKLKSGQRYTNATTLLPLHRFSAAHPVRSVAQFEELRAFFWVVGGDRDGFRFKDWSDYVATQSNSRLTQISGNNYQLNRVYTFGARTFNRPIYKPVAGVKVYRTRASVVTDITGASSIDTTTGIVEITGHVDGDTYTWEGEFHIPVAFEDPAAVFNMVMGGDDPLIEWPSFGVEEYRL